MPEVLLGKQDLRYAPPAGLERLLVGPHEVALAHGGGGLLQREVARSLPEPQGLHAREDGPRGHQDRLQTLCLQGGQSCGQIRP